jgi:hypothetical protein
MAAEQRVLAHLNFGNAAELRNAVLGASATRPSSPALGAIFFNSTANRVEYWDGTSWQTLAAEVFTQAAHDSHDHSAVASTIALNELGEPTGAVSFAGHRITNVATPTDSADAANKSYVDGAVSTEQTAREAADSALQSDIDAVASDLADETAAREAADSALDTRVTSVEGQLAALDTNFATDAEVAAAVAAETARAEAEEAALAATLSVVVGDIEQLSSNITDEVARATAAEGAIASDLADEVARATAAEGALDSRLTTAEGDIAALESDLAAEVARATAAEGALASDIADVAADLAAETTARENAVASVEGRVTSIEGTLPSLATSAQVAADLATEAARADAYADQVAAAAQAAAIAHADLVGQGLNAKESVVAIVASEVWDAETETFVPQAKSGTYVALDAYSTPDANGILEQMGVQLQVGDRVIFDDFVNGTSGIYIVQEGAWTVASDWLNDTTKSGSMVLVEKGLSAGRLFAAFENVDENGEGVGTYGWTLINGALTLSSDDGSINISTIYGLSVNVANVAASLVADEAFARKATATIGDGSATTFTVAHGLGIDVTVSIRDAATGEIVLAAVSCSSGSVTVEFVSAPAEDAYRVVIIG